MAVKELGEQCKQAQLEIANSLSDIVGKLIEKAKDEGSVPHAKFLVDWAELKPVAPEPAAKSTEKAPSTEETGEPDLAEELLKTLKEMLEEEKQAKAEEAKRVPVGISVH